MLAAHVLGTPLDAEASELLAKQSEGNPFLAEGLLQDWLETGVLTLTDARYCLASSVVLSLPSSIVNAVRQRLSRLSQESLNLLRTAAIIGRTFEGVFLAEVMAQDAETVEERLQEVVRARLLLPDRSGSFTFSHDTIRACLYDEVGPMSVCKRIHSSGRRSSAKPTRHMPC